MDELKRLYNEGLFSYIGALSIAQQEFSTKNQNIKTSIKRIAHSLREAGNIYGFPQISQSVKELEEAVSDEEIGKKTIKLIESLKQVAEFEDPYDIGILILHNDPTNYKSLEKRLNTPNREIFMAKNIKEALKIIEENEIYVIILDLMLSEIDGRNFIASLRENPKTTLTLLIVTSDKSDIQVEAECLALGTDVYIKKPFNSELLAILISSKLQRMSEISLKARKDNMTGLLNRTGFSEVFNRVSLLSMRQFQPLTLGLIDIDNLKEIKEEYGNFIGEQIICNTAQALTETLRKSDIIGHWKNYKLSVLLPNTDIDGATKELKRT